jgi:cold shock CspA family protein
MNTVNSSNEIFETKSKETITTPALDYSEKIFENIRFIGQVKWFNTKAGYGFITVCGNNMGDIKNDQMTKLLSESREQSVEEDQLLVAGEGKLSDSMKQSTEKSINVEKENTETDSEFTEAESRKNNSMSKSGAEFKNGFFELERNKIENILNLLKGKDIFVHYSSINAVNAQYKFLLQGEYVEFNILMTNGGKYEYHSANVSGIKGGTIMCETKKPFIQNQPAYQGKSLTYVDKNGVRHYSKFKSPRANQNNENSHSNVNETSPIVQSGKSQGEFVSKPKLVRSNLHSQSTTNSLRPKIKNSTNQIVGEDNFPEKSLNIGTRTIEIVDGVYHDTVSNLHQPLTDNISSLNMSIDTGNDNAGEFKTVIRGKNRRSMK